MKKFANIYDVIEEVLVAPGLHLGANSLEALQAYLSGYLCGVFRSKARFIQEQPPLHGFARWLIKRFDLVDSEMGWCRLVKQLSVRSEEDEMALFARLLHEYRGGIVAASLEPSDNS